jgi:hypothetical protein
VNNVIIRHSFDARAFSWQCDLVSLFLLIFILLNMHVPSDVSGYYDPQARGSDRKAWAIIGESRTGDDWNRLSDMQAQKRSGDGLCSLFAACPRKSSSN